jgi:signal transduction histidine kinase
MLSIRWRLTLFHALAIVVIAGVLIGILLATMFRGVTTSVRAITSARAAETVRLLETSPLPDDRGLATIAGSDVFLVVRDEQGRILAQAGRVPQELGGVAAAEREARWREALAAEGPITWDSDELHLAVAPVVASRSEARVVESWKSYDETAQSFFPAGTGITLVVPLGILLAVGGSFLLVRSALAPVDAITRAARAMSERDLSQRLPIGRQRDELGRLAATFNDLLARLEAAFRQRDATLAEQRRFIADASHELRTPLASIQGYARMLDRWALDDPAVARESVAAIGREAARMQSLVEGLLQLARGDEGAMPERTLGDLGAVAAEAVAAARVGAAAGERLRYQQPAAPLMAAFDREQIYRVAAILIDNALKYTPASASVTVTTRATARGVVLAVADTGPGIAADDLPHLFERFYRADPARGAGGAGLGLAIARQIAEGHGGTLVVDSTPGHGATFTLELPVA